MKYRTFLISTLLLLSTISGAETVISKTQKEVTQLERTLHKSKFAIDIPYNYQENGFSLKLQAKLRVALKAQLQVINNSLQEIKSYGINSESGTDIVKELNTASKYRSVAAKDRRALASKITKIRDAAATRADEIVLEYKNIEENLSFQNWTVAKLITVLKGGTEHGECAIRVVPIADRDGEYAVSLLDKSSDTLYRTTIKDNSNSFFLDEMSRDDSDPTTLSTIFYQTVERPGDNTIESLSIKVTPTGYMNSFSLDISSKPHFLFGSDGPYHVECL